MFQAPAVAVSTARLLRLQVQLLLSPGRPGSCPHSPHPAWVTAAACQHSTKSRFQDQSGTVTGQQWPLNRPAFALGGKDPFTEARPRPFPSPQDTQPSATQARPRAVSLNLRHPRAEPCSTLTAEPAAALVEGWKHACYPALGDVQRAQRRDVSLGLTRLAPERSFGKVSLVTESFWSF